MAPPRAKVRGKRLPAVLANAWLAFTGRPEPISCSRVDGRMNGSYERQFKWDLAILGQNYQAAALGKPQLAGQEKVQPGRIAERHRVKAAMSCRSSK